MTVKWADIEGDPDVKNYRAGFVAVFLKYRGQDTDEVDAYGRVVKVTAASFARHMGIDERAFQYWVSGRPSNKGAHIASISTPQATAQPQPAAAVVVPAPIPLPPPAPTMASFPPCVQVTFILADMETHLTEVLDEWAHRVTDPVERDEIRDRLRDQTGPLFAKVAALFGVTL